MIGSFADHSFFFFFLETVFVAVYTRLLPHFVQHFVPFGAYPTQLAAGFLLDLNPFVHVLSKQTFDTLVLWEMPHWYDHEIKPPGG